ncbi:MetQ/NlpA family ABC transporter substrate-binding protein [Planctomonas deserti]|uniref:MetQ/NlpA family ABC transporter substrate-binding protein n=1 Tax=Planctomonas deserti TaxID=2144185 RepID=UPI000D3D2689|nr:MetQ/NlpA family ABC transporter substrate-binding protein [Planctomonas deserti]
MNKKLVAALAVIPLVGALAGCSYGSSNEPAAQPDENGEVTVSIGTTEESQDYWTVLKDAAAEEGITIETVQFSDYTQANPALDSGEIDLNLFQHLQFLAEYNVGTDSDLTPVGATLVVPLGLYSKKHTSVEDIPQGGSVAIPNDPSNQARALLVLQEAGLISLTGGGNSLSTPADIDTTASKVTVTPVDAAQTILAMDSVDASIVNNNFVADAGLDFESSLFKDDPASDAAKPYINAFVARADDADNETFQKIVDLYHTPEVEEAVLEGSGGTAVIKDEDGAELQEILSGIEDNLREKAKS